MLIILGAMLPGGVGAPPLSYGRPPMPGAPPAFGMLLHLFHERLHFVKANYIMQVVECLRREWY
jgi:hypothetical protein